MTAHVDDWVLDNGLTVMRTQGTHITICGTEPTTYTQASATYLLGFKSWGTSAAFAAPTAGTAPISRKVVSVAITDGTITTGGTANWWAETDNTNSRILAVGQLSASQVVTAGNTFSLASFEVKIPNGP